MLRIYEIYEVYGIWSMSLTSTILLLMIDELNQYHPLTDDQETLKRRVEYISNFFVWYECNFETTTRIASC